MFDLIPVLNGPDLSLPGEQEPGTLGDISARCLARGAAA
jgi:3-dehydroquinate dehydratase